MPKRLVPRVLSGLMVVAVVAWLGVASATPALAYGKANWQLTFSATAPGFGFWGWCDLAGATTFNAAGQATSGTSGDCQFAEYFHNVPGLPSATCGVSFTLTPEADANGQLQPAWQQEPSSATNMTDWFLSGNQVIHPAGRTATCEQFPGISPTPVFSNFDSLLPVMVGHANLAPLFGTRVFQVQETPLP